MDGVYFWTIFIVEMQSISLTSQVSQRNIMKFNIKIIWRDTSIKKYLNVLGMTQKDDLRLDAYKIK